MEFIRCMFFICIILGVIVFGAICGVQLFQIKFVDNVPVKCYVDDEIVYEGISAGIEVKSTGRTTRVDIKNGFLYFFPKAYYVSDNVKLMGVKNE